MSRTYTVTVYRTSLESIEVEVEKGEFDTEHDLRCYAEMKAEKMVTEDTSWPFSVVDESFEAKEIERT